MKHDFFILLLAFTTGHSCRAHSLASSEDDVNCDDFPPFQSFHIHTLYWPDGEFDNDNPHGEKAAMDLRSSFIDHFGIMSNCTELIESTNTLCAFTLESGATPGFNFAHPFLVPNFAFYIPLNMFSETVPWIMQHRGKLDVFVHPNTGCPINDHIDWSTWGGQKWELKMSF